MCCYRHLLHSNTILSSVARRPRLGKRQNAIQFWIIAIPVFIAFVAVMGIGAWIGWTMATTPPPKPIEEITAEMEEKKEEEKPEKAEEPVEEAKAAEEPSEEEEKKKRKKSEK